MKKTNPRLTLKRVTVASLGASRGGGWYRSYDYGCSESCQTCQEDPACYAPSRDGQVCPEFVSMGYFTC